ncbi:hypothetical protein E6C60_3943 [Paenibacillus algicola]|uniref:Uncharacterized protein n=1 Tax=Paenibacillus algicola TaxID=2565926 RepID=A0A4P8XPQ9_9BACL|nr:hypothetical protein E6C60_3943 [Paenibacillus algicola]
MVGGRLPVVFFLSSICLLSKRTSCRNNCEKLVQKPPALVLIKKTNIPDIL